MIDVITAGHISLDMLPDIGAESAHSDSFLAPGRLVEVGSLTFAAGGSVSNTGVALHVLGATVRLAARVGNDRIGALTREVLITHNPALPEHLVEVTGERSSYTIVLNPPGVDRTFLHCPGANDTFGPEDLDPALLGLARIVHFGYPPLMRRMYADGGRALAQLLACARQAGATTSLDLAMPDPARPSGQADWPAILSRALPLVDLFVPSIEELLFMLDRPAFERITREHGPAGMIDALSPELIERLAQRALDAGARVVFIKLGHRGAYLRTAAQPVLGRGAPADPDAWLQRQLWAPAYSVAVRGTVGAGDATIAGLLTALLRGQGPEAAANTATAVGACNVEQPDAASGLLPWEATQQRIENGWMRLPSGVEAIAGWQQDAATGILRGPFDRRG